MAVSLVLCFHSHSITSYPAFFLKPDSNKVGGPLTEEPRLEEARQKKDRKGSPLASLLAFESNSEREGKGKKESSMSFYFHPLPASPPALPSHFDENKISPFFSSPPPHLFFPGFYHEPPAMQMNCIMQIYANKA